MILGTGCDLVEIERMKKACEKEAFLSRVYTEREQKNKGESPTGIPQFLLITILLRIRDIF